MLLDQFNRKKTPPKGKRSLNQSFEYQRTHFVLGDPSQIQKPESVNQYAYSAKKVIPYKRVNRSINTSSFNIIQTIDYDPKEHFASETRKKYEAPKFVAPVTPVRNSAQFNKSQYTLGDDKVEYISTTKQCYTDKSKEIHAEKSPLPSQVQLANIVKGRSNSMCLASKNVYRNLSKEFCQQIEKPIAAFKLDPKSKRVTPSNYISLERRASRGVL